MYHREPAWSRDRHNNPSKRDRFEVWRTFEKRPPMTTFMGKLLEDHKMAGFKHRGQAEQAMEAFRKLTEFAEYEPRYFIKEGR